jgi:hypothetical protein
MERKPGTSFLCPSTQICDLYPVGSAPGRPGGITATHRLDGWICPSAVDRRPQRMAGPKTRIHKGTTLGVRNRVVVRARLGRPSSRAGGGRGQQREHGLHHQRVDTRRGRENGPRVDAEAEAPRELRGPVRLSGASGLPSGRPHRPPQRTGHRACVALLVPPGRPRGAQRKRPVALEAVLDPEPPAVRVYPHVGM